MVGVNLLGLGGNIHTNLGLLVLSEKKNRKVCELRTLIQQEIVSCPANFTICTKQGY